LGQKSLKVNGKKRVLMFGGFSATADRAWGRRRAKGFVRQVVNARLAVFREQQRFVIQEEQHETTPI
jgi:hypothetical protein